MAITDAQLPQRTSLTAQIAESGDVLTSVAAAMAAVVDSHTVTVAADAPLPTAFQAPQQVLSVGTDGLNGGYTEMEEARTAAFVPQINAKFIGRLPTGVRSPFRILASGTGYTGHDGEEMAFVASGTGVGSASITTLGAVRYVNGNLVSACMTVCLSEMPAAEDPVEIMWGFGDEDDTLGNRCCFMLRAGVLGLLVYKQGVERHFYPLSLPTVDLTKINIFDTEGTWFGALPLRAKLKLAEMWETAAAHFQAGVGAKPHLGQFTLPMFVKISRKAGSGADIKLHTASWRGGSFGLMPVGSDFDVDVLTSRRNLTVSAGVPLPLVVYRAKQTFFGHINNIQVNLTTVSCAVQGTKPFVLNVLLNPTVVGGTYADQDAQMSVVERNTTMTSVTGGTLIGDAFISKEGNIRVNLRAEVEDVPIRLRKGDVIALTLESTGNGEANFSSRTTDRS